MNVKRFDEKDFLVASPVFDDVFYRQTYKLQGLTRPEVAAYYLEKGSELGHDPHPLFHNSWYTKKYGITTNPLLHYLLGGHSRCEPNALFDSDYYLSQKCLTRDGPNISLVLYCMDGVHHRLDSHPLFEASAYLKRYPDVFNADIDPLAHYFEHGTADRRVPCLLFDPTYYLESYADVKDAGMNPLVHYIEFGAQEGRDPSSVFDTKFYARSARLDVSADTNPLTHYKLFGLQQGLPTYPAELNLSPAFTAPIAKWAEWLTNRARPKGPQSVATIDRVVFVLPNAAAVRSWPNISSVLLQNSSKRLNASTITFTGVMRKSFRESLDGATLLIFVNERDLVSQDELASFVSTLDNIAQLIVFDLAELSNDTTIRPIMLPGANLHQLRAVDACRSRFALRGSLMSRLLQAQKSWTCPRDLMLGALNVLESAANLRAFVHQPYYILSVPALTGNGRLLTTQLAESSLKSRETCVKGGDIPNWKVSVIILTKDKCHLLTQLVHHLIGYEGVQIERITIVTNEQSNPVVEVYHKHLAALDRVWTIAYNGDFNFSAECNLGAFGATSEFLLFLNDDIIPIGDSWLTHMLGVLSSQRVGAVGPLLLYPDERVQHAGMYLGLRGSAGHGLRGATLPVDDPNHYTTIPRQTSSLTGATLLVRRSVYEQVGGFDEQLGTILQDVDFCMRVSDSGFVLVYEPKARLLHCESISIRAILETDEVRGRMTAEKERFDQRWGSAIQFDPFHNHAYNLQSDTLRVLR